MSNEIYTTNCDFATIASYNPNNCLSFYSHGSSITLWPNKITYEGYENTDKATKGFLNMLVEFYPSFVEMIKNGDNKND